MRKFSNLIDVISAVQPTVFDATALEQDIKKAAESAAAAQTAAATAATAAATADEKAVLAAEKAATASSAAATADEKAVTAKAMADDAKDVSLQAVALVSNALDENTQLDAVALALNQANTTLLGTTIGNLALLEGTVKANKEAVDSELSEFADDLVVTFTKVNTNFRTVGVAV